MRGVYNIEDKTMPHRNKMVPVNSGRHEDEIRTKELLDEWQRNSSGFIDTDELSLT